LVPLLNAQKEFNMHFKPFFITCSLLAWAASASAVMVSSFGSSKVFQPSDTEATVIASGATSVTFGNTTIYTGYRQVSANDQNPILASFTNGVQDWAITDYDTSPVDAQGRGLGWNTTDGRLYAAFSTDGGAGSGSHTRFNDPGRMDNAWQGSYGSGGGPKVSVIYEIDLTDGSVLGGTYLIARLSGGNTNSMSITDFDWYDGQLVVYANSWFRPLNPDKSTMVEDGSPSSPFEYRGLFSADLESLNAAEAIGFNGVTAFSPIPEPAHVTLLAGLAVGLLLVVRRRKQTAA